MQNFDPLSDSAPPRYAIESDEEEDEYNPLDLKNLDPNDCPSALSIIIEGNNIPNRKERLIIATGDAGKYWAKGSRLGEQTGSVQVNGVEVRPVYLACVRTETSIFKRSALSFIRHGRMRSLSYQKFLCGCLPGRSTYTRSPLLSNFGQPGTSLRFG